MKKFIYLTLVVLFVFILNACSDATPKYVEGMINPGDEIDGMVFTHIDEVDWDNSLAFLCDLESMEETDTIYTLACFTSPGGGVFFGNCNGITYITQEEAENRWEEFKMDVTFDGHLVNLPLFSFLDLDAYEMEDKYLRIWNLKVDNITSGTHLIECKW